MIRRPPRSTRTDTLFPYTTLFRSLKQAVLLSFRLNDMGLIAGGPGLTTHWWDKVPSKFEGWNEADFRKAGFRAVPGSIVRPGAYVQPGAVLLPSFMSEEPRVGQECGVQGRSRCSP